MKRLSIFGLLWIFFGPLYGQTKVTDTIKLKKEKLKPLFQSDDVLQLTIVTNLKVLLKDRGDKPQNHWANLVYTSSDNDSVAMPIKIKVRGNFRRSAKNCLFPPLLLDLPKKETQNDVFSAQNRLKLVTHCQTEDYIFQEYMVYKMYNLLTEYSFKARLAQVTYIDSVGKRDPQTKYAFLIEDEEDMAKRNKTKNYTLKQVPMQRVDSLSMATVAVFEYLIGNSDWSVPFLHNIKLLTKKDYEYPLAVPYDFDHAGLVEAKYARPAEQLDLTSVRQRLYRGLTYPPEMLNQVFDKFRQVKAAIYSLYETNPQLNSGYVKRSLRYFDEFYKTIDNPKEVKKIFVYGGGKPQGSGVVIKGLN